MKTVRDIMTTNVVTARRETTIRELAELFSKYRIGSIPIVDEAGNLAGIVTESDLIEQDKSLHIPTVISLFDWVIYLESAKKFEREIQKVTGQTAGDIYTTEVESVTSETPVSTVADIMANKKLHTLPVVEGKKLVGIVSRIDLIRTMVG